jgi:hypothetical protein
MSNRQHRRASERGRGPKVLAGFRLLLTPDEAALVEEALHDYHMKITSEVDGEPTSVQRWALERSEVLRASLDAAIDNRPFFDAKPERQQPTAP